MIESVEAWACSLPLDSPLDFGGFTIASRDYVAIRIRTEQGLIAECVGLSRRAPVDLCVLDVLAPHLLGKDASAITAVLHDLKTATRALEQDGLLGKARSLIDICLWDILSQKAGMPLWKLLGGNPRPLPVLLVEGYPLPDESDDAFADRLAARVGESFHRLKIEAASYENTDQVTTRLAKIRDRVGDDVALVVDVLYRWPNAHAAVSAAQSWQPYRLDWLEDPLPRERAAEYRRLHDRLDIPIASGDEATRSSDVDALIAQSAIDVVRLDATTQGGFDAATELMAKAQRRGLRLSTHVHPEVHQHIAFASTGIDHIEAFPLDERFDRTHNLLREPFMAQVRDGMASPPDRPGTGIALDIDAVQKAAYRYGTRTREMVKR